MKKILFFLLFFVYAYGLMAQKTSYKKGDNIVHLGVGIGATYYGSYGYGGGTNGLPLLGSYEYGFTDRISGGGIIQYSSQKYNFNSAPYTSSVKYSYLIIGARANYHFLFFNGAKLDPYAGATLGYDVASSSVSDNSGYGGITGSPGPTQTYSAASGALVLGLQAGVNYNISKNVGVFGEVGFGTSVLSLGLLLKF